VYKRQIYQTAESNRIEKNRFGSENRIETFFARIGMLYCQHQSRALSGSVASWDQQYISIIICFSVRWLAEKKEPIFACYTFGIFIAYRQYFQQEPLSYTADGTLDTYTNSLSNGVWPATADSHWVPIFPVTTTTY